MTPMARWLAAWLPRPLIEPVLVLVYASLLYLLFWQISAGLTHAIPYLDVGRG